MDKARCVNCRTEIDDPAGLCPRRPHQVRHLRHQAQGAARRRPAAGAGRRQAPEGRPARQPDPWWSASRTSCRGARRSFGIGANGLGIGGDLPASYRSRLNEPAWSLGPASPRGSASLVGTGLLLELANFLFLAKRQQMTRLSEEIQTARADGREIQRKIREAAGR